MVDVSQRPPPSASRTEVRAASARLPHLPGLDGLRGIAVAAVLLYHAGVSWIPGGFLGVEVFFAVSGYLITQLLLGEKAATGRVSLGNFWKRRARRLLPALLTMIAAVTVVWALFVRERLAQLKTDVVASLFYVQNWHLIATGQSYFDNLARPSPLRHVWSLAVEEQFYVLWPLIVVVLVALSRGRRRPLAIAMAAGALASYVLMQVLYTPGGDPSRVYYGTDTRASALLLGGLLAVVWRADRRRDALTSPSRQLRLEGAAAAGLVLLGLLFATTTDNSPFLYRAGFVLCAGATLAIVAAVARPTWIGRFLGLRPLLWVGQRSYSLYLWHWPVFVLTRPALDLHWEWWRIFVLRMILTIGLSMASYRFIESPARHGAIGRWWRSVRSRTTGAGRVRRQTLATCGVVALFLVPSAIVLARAEPKVDQIEASIESGQDALQGQVLPPTTEVGSPTSTSTAAATTTLSPGVTATTRPTATSRPPAVAPTTKPASNPVPTTRAAAVPKPATTKAPVATGPVIMIGDSVMLGAAGELKTRLGPSTYVDAQVSRAFVRGISVAQTMQAQGWLGPKVVVQLGENGPIRAGEFDQMMAALRGVPEVLFLTVKVPRSWEDDVNRELAAQVPRYPNAKLADWRGFSIAHPDWFYSDGIHLNPAGRAAYADFVARSL
jgi:peptidoglycan/LPS O-acetylase OafA/YrhL